MKNEALVDQVRQFKTKTFWGGWLLWVLGILLATLTGIYGYLDTLTELAKHGTARATSSAFFYIVIFVILSIIVIGLFIFLITRKKVSVTIYPDFILIKQTKKVWKISSQDILEIYQSEKTTWMGILPIRKGKIVLKSEKGKVELTSSVSLYDQMVRDIEGNVFPWIQARYQRDLDTGKSIHFNGLTINKSGFTYQNQVSFWSDIGQCSVKNGIMDLVITHEGGNRLIQVPVELIPNLPLFLKYLNDYTKT